MPVFKGTAAQDFWVSVVFMIQHFITVGQDAMAKMI